MPRSVRPVSAFPDRSGCTRRTVLTAGAGAWAIGLGAALPAWAQDAAAPAGTAAAPLESVGIYALLGESIQVVLSEDPELSGGVFNRTEDMTLPGLGLDALALQVLIAGLNARNPAPRQHLFRANEPITLTDQRTISDGARRGALPGWIIDSIETHQLSHVLLLTRHRGPAQFTRPDGGTIGRGNVEGIGFYIDPVYQPRNLLTGAPPVGALGVYIDAMLTLFDTQSASVVAGHHVRAGQLHLPANEAQGLEPWSILDSRRKIEALRALVESTLQRDLPRVLSV